MPPGTTAALRATSSAALPSPCRESCHPLQRLRSCRPRFFRHSCPCSGRAPSIPTGSSVLRNRFPPVRDVQPACDCASGYPRRPAQPVFPGPAARRRRSPTTRGNSVSHQCIPFGPPIAILEGRSFVNRGSPPASPGGGATNGFRHREACAEESVHLGTSRYHSEAARMRRAPVIGQASDAPSSAAARAQPSANLKHEQHASPGVPEPSP